MLNSDLNVTRRYAVLAMSRNVDCAGNYATISGRKYGVTPSPGSQGLLTRREMLYWLKWKSRPVVWRECCAGAVNRLVNYC